MRGTSEDDLLSRCDFIAAASAVAAAGTATPPSATGESPADRLQGSSFGYTEFRTRVVK